MLMRFLGEAARLAETLVGDGVPDVPPLPHRPAGKVTPTKKERQYYLSFKLLMI